MEEYEYSYSDYDNNDSYEEVNHAWGKSSGGSTMKDLSGTASSPKLSARNSADDFNDVFGGPPKYIALKQLKDPKKAQTLLQPAGGLSGLEVPVFGETRRRYVDDEFYNDIFNSDGETGEMSGKCCSVAASPSPAQSPLPKFIDCKAFGSRSPLAPKLRHPVNSSKKIEYSPFGAYSHYGTSKFYNDSSVVSSAHSSPSDHTIPLLDIPFGRCSRPPKQLFEAKLGLKRQQEIGVLPPRSSNSRYQPFLEPGESILETPARLSSDKLYSTAQTTCSSTPDDELGGNVHGLNRHINRRVFVEKYGSDSGKRSSSGEKEEIGFEKARLSASDVPFTRHQQPPWSPPLQAFHIQNKLKSWRDWFPEPKVLHSNGSLSLGSAGHSSTREINTDTGTSNPQELSEEIRPKRFSTSVDSDEESDDIGSYVIEIDTKRGETIAFLPERDFPIDSGNALNPSISSTKELMKSAKNESLPVPSRPVDDFSDDAKGCHSRLQSLSQKTYDFDVLGKIEAKMQSFQISKGNSRRRDSSKTTTSQHIPHKSTWAVQPPAMEHNTKESLIKELQREALHDPYSIDPSAMVKEVSSKIEKWHCEQLVVFQEMPQALERIDKAEGPSEKETPENRRKRLEKERHLRTKERVSKVLIEKKKKELEAEEEQTDKAKTLEKLDNEIKRWSLGKEGNIRALLSTLQYVLWSESGWSPIPLIDIIEGAAVKKAYQKARLCVHPDKLQQKRASAQQKYIAEKVFDILQEAWAIYNSMDDF